jgi:hypothetical protein
VVSRGTIGVSTLDDPDERVVRDRLAVDTGERFRADELSQGHLTFADGLGDDRVIATVQLLGGSRAELSRATRPRFGLGDAPYSILLTQVVGRVEVVIAPRLEREIRLEIENGGRRVRLDQAGHYLLQFGADSLTVTVREGKALVIDGQGSAKLLEPSQTVSLQGDNPIDVQTVLLDLIANSRFTESGAEPTLPDRWGCYEQRDDTNEPAGVYERVLFQDRYALHLDRTGPGRQHQATTGCQQRFVATDVRGYDSLTIRATVYLASHSVSGCGAQGTECAVILRMQYYNEENLRAGTISEWIQGFYIHFDERTGARIRCDSCTRNHQHVNAEAWYTFESDDFVLDLSIEQRGLRPVEIVQISVYASGHEYEAYISEIALLGRQAKTQTPGASASP